MTLTPESVSPPVGVVAPRYRPPTGSSTARAFSLDGDWRFRYFETVHTGVERSDSGDDWSTIGVPGHWQLAGAPSAWPYGVPEYNNRFYPFSIEPPHVPDANPTGEYRTMLRLPADWPIDGRTLLRFEGVDSWFEVAVGGEVVAVSHGSRLPTEIDVTDLLVNGEALLSVRVTKWSAMSYIEDQDQWWLSGIFRSVTLEHRPVDGIDDVRITAEYDHTTGLGRFRVDAATSDDSARATIPELGLDLALGEEALVAVEPWSAELPRLYNLTVSSAGETVALAIGFRTIAVDNAVLLVNGNPVKFRGVNRHEFDQLRGRAVTPEQMVADVLLMKRHNINAVRTSHYPPHPHFLDLCDRYGLYVIDENDLETHGFEEGGWVGNPVNDPDWTDVLVDRVTRMVRRDAHHASIVMWSLGNEAGGGINVPRMVAAIRALDESRLVHYEGDWSSEDVDVYSRMYATTEHVELIGQGNEPPLERAVADAHRRTLPFIQCEYAHAMGNGPGGLADYDEIFDRYPRLAGGFIWEWNDHGLLRHDANGTPFAAYGGDFGERFHDGTFIADGLVLPDRTASPSLREVAAIFAPIRIDTHPDGLLVRNRYAHRDSSHVTFEWRMHRGDQTIASGVLDIALAPGESQVVSPPSDLPIVDSGRAPVWFTVSAVQYTAHALETEWMLEPFTLSQGQLLLVPADSLERHVSAPARTDGGGYQVGHARFDSRGTLLELHGRAVAELRVDAWRAPTDNDRRSGMWLGPTDQGVWLDSGLDLLVERKKSVELTDDGTLVVEARTAGPHTRNGFATRYEWRETNDGGVDLVVSISPEGRWGQSIARLGILLALEEARASEVDVAWLGLGPDESYTDSRRAAIGGAWQHSVAELQTNYTHPQENGARRGVTEASLAFADGSTLRIDAGDVTVGATSVHGLELSLRPWSDLQLENAAHPHELSPDGLLWMHLDAAQHGLGSAACGPGVLANAQLHAVPARMNIRFTSV